MTSIGAWKNRCKKFFNNPKALIPFLKKYWYYNFVCDKHLSLYANIHFLGHQETIDELLTHEKSFVRFGDELIDMFHGIGLYYGDWHQRYNKRLAEHMKTIVSSRDEKLLIGLHWQYFTKTKEELRSMGVPSHLWTNSKVFLKQYLHDDMVYGSALCFQPKFNQQLDMSRIVAYWKQKHIIVVTGNIKRFGGIELGMTTDFVDCPCNDSWSVYDDIRDRAMQLVRVRGYDSNKTLFLVSLASPGKVLVFDLVKAGHHAWDTGQLFDLALTQIQLELG